MDRILNKREVFKHIMDEIDAFGWGIFNDTSSNLLGHTHPNSYEICFIAKGSVDWWAGEESYRLNRHDIYVTKPDEFHGGVNGVMQPCELYWLILQIPLLEAKLSLSPALSQGFAQLQYRHFAGNGEIAGVLRQMREEHRLMSENSVLAIRAWLVNLLILVLRAHHDYQISAQRRNPSVAIRKAVAWMESNSHHPIHIEKVAQVANMSVSYFYKRFLIETGLSPAQYLTRYRVEQAKRSLIITHASITDIAYQSGFSSSQYFATVFKKFTGKTPHQYRINYRLKTSLDHLV